MPEFFRKVSNNLIECTACRWYCKIPDGFVGICGVRANEQGSLQSLVYGYVSSIAIDPIEKKPLFHVLPGTTVLSTGTLGCNFSCKFCQNWEISQTPKLLKEQLITKHQHPNLLASIKEFIKSHSTYLPPEKIIELTRTYKTPSIAFTYNEPTINVEYAIDVMQIAKECGILGVFVSSGYESTEVIEALDGLIDAYNIDLKAGTQEFYTELTGGIKIDGVLDTIKRLYQQHKWIEITTLLIPDKNTDNTQIRFIAEFIRDLNPLIPWHITAFYPAYKMLDTPPTSPKNLLNAYEIAREIGLKYVYTGNIIDSRTQNTYCHNCNTLLIQRRGYQVRIHGLDTKTGKCQKCGTKIPGIWEQATNLLD